MKRENFRIKKGETYKTVGGREVTIVMRRQSMAYPFLGVIDRPKCDSCDLDETYTVHGITVRDHHGQNDIALPEPTYRPYTAEEAKELVGQVLIQTNNGWHRMVLCDGNEGVVFASSLAKKTGTHQVERDDLLEWYTHLDGTPCGILEDE